MATQGGTLADLRAAWAAVVAASTAVIVGEEEVDPQDEDRESEDWRAGYRDALLAEGVPAGTINRRLAAQRLFVDRAVPDTPTPSGRSPAPRPRVASRTRPLRAVTLTLASGPSGGRTYTRVRLVDRAARA